MIRHALLCLLLAPAVAAEPAPPRSDTDVFRALLEHREQIQRTVKKLRNGVETLTESSDPAVAALLRAHATAMRGRLDDGRLINSQDPLFAELFLHADKITTRVEETGRGVRVVETSTDPYVVKLVQARADVMDRFLKDGPAELQRRHELPAR
ncbi:MAG TPA: hypothetical protein VJS92_02220 [Candidatus Polarisedimenticolaceae bacterium]|nr:hypothetical protein [Candidatus Polarisedimenticolaceae bacterium]